ncbi:progesterone receptor [Hoplias malabaricus]|uniref:progesterone receptor n=1 Tax=Hoplias malabaricus TaxID=27720 RepID=UPI0034629608
METKVSDGVKLVQTAADSSGKNTSDLGGLIDPYTELSFGHGDRALGLHAAATAPHGFSGSSTDVQTRFSPKERAFGACNLLKLEPGEWSDLTDNILQLKDSGRALEGSAPAGTGLCTFIKDESEPSLIAEPQRCAAKFQLAHGNVNVNVLEMDDAFDAARKETPALLDDSAALDTNFLENLSQESSPAPFPQLRATDLRQFPVAKAPQTVEVVSAPSQQHLLMCKSEGGRWQPSPTEFWCPTAGVGEEQLGHSEYATSAPLHGSGFGQRSAAYSLFPGVPPQRMCVICGDEASGCHYGVLTCGSCKVFFKRAVEGHHNYLCAGRNDCIVDKIRRKNCPACRLRKCYQAGMMLGGRKLKRFGVLKAMGLGQPLMFQSPLALMAEGHTSASMSCMPGLRDLQISPQIISILDSIEPEVVYSGYDSSQPELPHLLLNSLNRLCERQLVWIVKWSKSLPGFRNLHINDQMTLIQYSWMNLMVFSLGWRSFQNVTNDYLYFAPDLILSQDRMRRSPIYELCLAMQFIPQEFANLQVTKEEYLCMKALMLLNTVPLEGLKSQGQFDEMRQNYIRELTKAIQIREKGVVGSSQRFYHLTKLMDAMHEIVKKVNLYCLSTFIQAEAMKVEFPEMMTEVISSQLPKVLAGMVRPLLFHNK